MSQTVGITGIALRLARVHLPDEASRRRLLIGALVLLAHMALLVAIQTGVSTPQPAAPSNATRRIVVNLVPDAFESPRQHAPAPARRRDPIGRTAQPQTSRGDTSAIAPGTPVEPATATAAAPPATPPASALRWDDRSLRDAARSVRPTLSERLNADRSELRAPPAAAARLGESVDAASIPDCLRADALRHLPLRMGGLLDLPLLAYAAAQGLCK